MLETPHVIVGAAIATKITNPILSIPLAFASHFVLDRVPHWNPHLNTELKKEGRISKKTTKIVIFDVGLSLISGLAIASLQLPDTTAAFWVVMGAFFAVLPDVVEGPYFFFHYKTKVIEKWMRFQKAIQVDTDPVPGLFIQLVTVLATLFWISR